jgi:hypothetical protein
MLRRTSLVLTALILYFAFSARADDQAYVWDGNTLQPLFNTEGIYCTSWSIWLFSSDNHSKTPGTQWGNIVKDSEAAATAKLKETQSVEDKVMEITGHHNWLTYYNYTGPICNVKPPESDANDKLEQMEALIHRLENSYSDVSKLLQFILVPSPKNGNPFSLVYDPYGPKSMLQDYLTQLMDTMQRVNSLRGELMQRNRGALMTVESAMRDIMAGTESVENKGNQIKRTLGPGTNVVTNWLTQRHAFDSFLSKGTVSFLQPNESGFIAQGSFSKLSMVAVNGVTAANRSWTETVPVSFDNLKDVTCSDTRIYISFRNPAGRFDGDEPYGNFMLGRGETPSSYPPWMAVWLPVSSKEESESVCHYLRMHIR